MTPRSLLGKFVVGILSVFVITAGGLGVAVTSGMLTVGQPTVEEVRTDWGAVNPETSEIRTEIDLHNPSSVGVPGVADVTYAVGMNDVTVAEGTSNNVGVPTGESTISLLTRMDNQKIPAWWATHINNGEQTTVSIQPAISLPLISKNLPAEERSFETNLLGAFESNETQTMTAGERTVLRVTETDAEWGEATEERTPLNVDATVENPTSGDVAFSQLGYTITMNDVTVAEGTTDGEVNVAPGERTSFSIDSTFDNGKLPAWWESHVENGEQTTMDVQFYATVDENGETKKVTLPFLSKRVVFTTDVLGGGETTTKTVPRTEATEFEPPKLQSVESEWVVPETGNTGIRTSAVVQNPNQPGSLFADRLSVDANYRVLMNDVQLVEGQTSQTLDSGRSDLELSGDITDREVQQWWVGHVNNGEETDRVVERDVTVDAGFARLPVGGEAERGTITTDMLGPVDSNSTLDFSVAGRQVGTVSGTQAEWGDATMAETPIESSAVVKNDQAESIHITEIGYRVTMNDVVLADEANERDIEIAPNSEKTIRDTVPLDNSKLGDWWKTHLQQGEESTLSVEYYVIVEYQGYTERVELDALNYEKSVTTDMLGNESA
ncbi:LEA14-like dessication related protein [Haladaptatus litoreus]|uniref:LEA14-like dessication related protein n=1 Tax=Haladaptatus litoreus TaxID=553468 RepID=A0A1N7BAQ4_9EURY|nr:LEA type 2 family protein [Haladaptatus litoreus]SIR48362.1 LEA14-like dessication related protein [Haladaptatus litoreus]